MNRAYRTVFNRTLGVWQAVSELAKGRAKAGRSTTVEDAAVSTELSHPSRRAQWHATLMVGLFVATFDASPTRAATVTWAASATSSDWFTVENWLRVPGGSPVAGDAIYVGNTTPAGAAANGAVTIVAGSAQGAQLYLGYASDTKGELTVQQGASLGITGSLMVGRLGTGHLNIDGGNVSSSGRIDVGYATSTNGGDGHIAITNGGTLTGKSTGYSIVGNRAGTPQSTVLIDGPGSAWNTVGGVIIGGSRGGSGAMTIRNGGVLNMTNPSNSTTNFGLGLADSTGANGSLIITGDGSKVVTTPGISVGIQGTGHLSILDGATLESGADLIDYDYLGQIAASASGPRAEGHVVVDGPGSSWTNHTALMVGYTGIGTLAIRNGAEVSSAYDSRVGYSAITGAPDAAYGEVTITGAGSIWTTGTLDMAQFNGAQGALTVADGGTFKTTDAAGIKSVGNGGRGTINVGAAQGAPAAAPGVLDTSIINLGAQGTLVFNHTDTSGYVFAPQLASTAPASGSVTQLAGMTIMTGDSSAFGGTTTVSGGTLQVDGNLGNASSSVAVDAGATLAGSGALGGNATFASGAILAPGGSNTAPGTLTVKGNLVLDGGSLLNYDFGQAGMSGGPLNDLTVVDGDLTLGGTLNVAVSPGGNFLPGIYRVFSYGGTLTDNGLNLGTIPPAGAHSIQTSLAGQVNLVTATAGLHLTFWDGGAGPQGDGVVNGGNGTWQSGAGNSNWTDSAGAQVGGWADRSFAVFMGSPGTVTVDNSLGAVTAAGMQFASDGYVVQGGDITLTDSIDAPDQAAIRVGDGTSAGAGHVATIDARLTGHTQLLKADLGTLVLNGDNRYTGGTAIHAGTVQVSADNNLGDPAGTLSFDGGTLRAAASFTTARDTMLDAGGGAIDVDPGTTLTMTGAMDGVGGLNKSGAGALILTGVAHYSGDTAVSVGTLRAGAANTFSSSSAFSVASTGTLDLNGLSQTVAGLTNAGLVNMGTSTSPGAVLRVNGDYLGQGGTIALNTYLGDDASPSDKLSIDGGTASGNSLLRIANAGGGGAQTMRNGILVVDTPNGGTTSVDAFSLDGRVVAGAYEYRLLRGSVDDSNTQAWYLRSQQSTEPDKRLYRPEVAAYLANQRVAGEMFVHSLHDRLGEPQYVEGEGVDPNPKKGRAGWMRMVGNREGSQSKDGNFEARTDSFLLQGGTDLADWKVFGDADRARVGLMGSYGSASTDASAQGSPYRAKGKVEGWSVGAYGTWYQNDESKLGAYVDTWAQYGWFRNRVEGESLPTVRYNAQGLAASGEAGYALPLGNDWVIEPQGQLIYLEYHQHDITEANGTRVRGGNANGLIARAGARLHRTFERDDARKVQPYVAVNWWHSEVNNSVSFDDQKMDGMYPSNRYELKVGLNADLRKGWTGWTNVSGSWGAQDYREYAVRAGVRYSW